MVTLVSQYTARLCRSTSLYIMSASSWLTNLGTCSANSYICCTACLHHHSSQTGVPAKSCMYIMAAPPWHHYLAMCTQSCIIIPVSQYTGITAHWCHNTLTVAVRYFMSVHWCHSTQVSGCTGVTACWCHSTHVSGYTHVTKHWCHGT